MVNGGEAIDGSKIKMYFYNQDHEILTHELDLGRTNPYETRIIYPAQIVDLQKFLKGKPGAAKVQFDLKWVFPRLLVGNINHRLPAVTITHTYYDCTEAAADSDYWRPSESIWYPASLMIPLTIENDHFTNVYFYPIYSPSSFFIDVEIYNGSGDLLGKKENVLEIHSPGGDYLKIPFKTLCNELKITPEKHLAARIIARGKDNTRIPSRIKLGLDIGSYAEHLPCNICTNLQPFNPPLESKPKSFKWAPVLADQPEAFIWIMNSAPNISYRKAAEIELTFFREKDAETLMRKITLPPHGFIVIDVNWDEELKEFFGSQVGWVTVVTSNPYTTTYYIAENPSGVVGGDHGF